MQGSPADPGGGVAIPKPVRRLRTRPPKNQPAKRRRRASTTDNVTATSDEEVPTHKRRSVAASDGLRRGAQSALRPAQKPRTCASDQSTSRRSTGASAGASALPPDEYQATDHAGASYQEWPLPDAVLQRIQVNGRTILQLRFTWATPCASHKAPAAMPTAQLPETPSTRRGLHGGTRASETSNGGTERADAGNIDRDGKSNIHIVAKLLTRWKRGTYLLE